MRGCKGPVTGPVCHCQQRSLSRERTMEPGSDHDAVRRPCIDRCYRRSHVARGHQPQQRGGADVVGAGALLRTPVTEDRAPRHVALHHRLNPIDVRRIARLTTKPPTNRKRPSGLISRAVMRITRATAHQCVRNVFQTSVSRCIDAMTSNRYSSRSLSIWTNATDISRSRSWAVRKTSRN